jgi:hypothetical protein
MMRRRWGSHLGLPRMAVTTEKGHAVVTGLPRGLVVARAHDGGAPMMFLASMVTA